MDLAMLEGTTRKTARDAGHEEILELRRTEVDGCPALYKLARSTGSFQMFSLTSWVVAPNGTYTVSISGQAGEFDRSAADRLLQSLRKFKVVAPKEAREPVLPSAPARLPSAPGRVLEGATVVLAPGYAVGQRWEYETRIRSVMTMRIGDAPKTIDTASEGRNLVEILEAPGGIPVAIRMTIESAHVTQDGKEVSVATQGYHGKPFVARIADSGELTIEGLADEADRASVKGAAQVVLEPPPYLPDPRPLRAGDTWTHARKLVSQATRVAGRLLAVREWEGRKLADVEVAMTMRVAGSDVEQHGTAVFDVETGAMLESHVESATTGGNHESRMQIHIAVRRLR